MPAIITPIITEEQKKRHQALFKQNHILGPRDLNSAFAISNKSHTLSSKENMTQSQTDALSANHSELISTPQSHRSNDSFDSSFNSDAQLTPLTHNDVANNPQTPYLREEYRTRKTSSDDGFSPAIATTGKKLIDFNTPNGKGAASRSSLLRSSMTNRLLANSSSSASNSSSDLAEIAAGTPSHVNLPMGPSSILKKSRNINYDRETSQLFLERRPDLSTAVNENGELNPLKAVKRVVMSPKKEIIPSWKSFPKGTRFSSPLTDSIEGKFKHGVKSPYVRSSPRKSNAAKESEWIDDDDITMSSKKGKKTRKDDEQRQKKKKSNLKKFLQSLIDPQLPYILSLYLQLLFNVVIVSILLYFVYTFISTVRADVENKVDSYATDIIQEIALCSREYARNNCQPGRRVVALEAACSEWERCMNRDPATVGRARIGAETFAEIINGFIKPISWKSMFFLLLITVGSLVLTNAAFGTYRNYNGHANQNQQQQQQQQQQHQNGFGQQTPLPQTPGLPHTPHQTPYKSLQMNPQYTRYYTPKPASPTNGVLVRHRTKSAKPKSKK